MRAAVEAHSERCGRHRLYVTLRDAVERLAELENDATI
jgi:hypothetical protein